MGKENAFQFKIIEVIFQHNEFGVLHTVQQSAGSATGSM